MSSFTTTKEFFADIEKALAEEKRSVEKLHQRLHEIKSTYGKPYLDVLNGILEPFFNDFENLVELFPSSTRVSCFRGMLKSIPMIKEACQHSFVEAETMLYHLQDFALSPRGRVLVLDNLGEYLTILLEGGYVSIQNIESWEKEMSEDPFDKDKELRPLMVKVSLFLENVTGRWFDKPKGYNEDEEVSKLSVPIRKGVYSLIELTKDMSEDDLRMVLYGIVNDRYPLIINNRNDYDSPRDD